MGIRKYLPALKKFPAKYIYAPWTAPISVQKAAKCIIGEDYPKPIVDHKIVHKVNIARMKTAYGLKKYGSPRGVPGSYTWAAVGGKDVEAKEDASGEAGSAKKRKKPSSKAGPTKQDKNQKKVKDYFTKTRTRTK